MDSDTDCDTDVLILTRIGRAASNGLNELDGQLSTDSGNGLNGLVAGFKFQVHGLRVMHLALWPRVLGPGGSCWSVDC
jgi:hypothetical protein